MTQGNVQRGDRVLKVIHDHAIIKRNLGPTVGEYLFFGNRRGLKQKRRGATVKANAFYGTEIFKNEWWTFYGTRAPI